MPRYNRGFSIVPKSHQGDQKVRNSATPPAPGKPNPDYKPPATVKKELKQMATNPKSSGCYRNGEGKQQSQTYNLKTDVWTKRNIDTVKLMDGKKVVTLFKSVRKKK